jgi:hypothetical protein
MSQISEFTDGNVLPKKLKDQVCVPIVVDLW